MTSAGLRMDDIILLKMAELHGGIKLFLVGLLFVIVVTNPAPQSPPPSRRRRSAYTRIAYFPLSGTDS